MSLAPSLDDATATRREDLLDGNVLCLASGGDHQGPLFAAVANVTVFDASGEQQRRDREVSEREGSC